jgi:hypothetical protein
VETKNTNHSNPSGSLSLRMEAETLGLLLIEHEDGTYTLSEGGDSPRWKGTHQDAVNYLTWERWRRTFEEAEDLLRENGLHERPRIMGRPAGLPQDVRFVWSLDSPRVTATGMRAQVADEDENVVTVDIDTLIRWMTWARDLTRVRTSSSG